MADEKDIAAIRFVDSTGALLRSTVNPDVSCLVPEGALKLQMNFIPVSIQVINIDEGLVQEFFGQGSAISPIMMIEPVRRKFHKPLTVEIPVPKHGDSHTVDITNLKILISLSGNGDNVKFEDTSWDISTAEHTDRNTLIFTSLCTGRFVLVSCTNSILDIADTMNDLYRKNLAEGYTSSRMQEEKLFRAAKSGDVEHLREALKSPGIDIDQINKDGQTVFHIACKEGHTEIIEELLKRNADMKKFSTRGNAPIHLACYYGHKNIVELLLDHAVDVNTPSKSGYPPLYASILENHCDIMQLLISRSARSKWVSPDGLSLILVAVFSKFNRDRMFSMVELLKDSFNLESQPLSSQLKEKGFKNHGEALLHCLILRTNNLGGKEILEPVRQKLANLSCAQLKEDLDSIELAEEDVTQCLNAVKENDTEKFDLIIAKGFDINSCTKRSVTALHLACLYGHDKIVEMILDLIKAADVSSVEDCLNQSIALNKQTQGGFTGLHLAAQEGYKGIVKMLLDAGASENIVNNYGLTAQDIATEMGHKEITTLLRDSKVPKHLFESASSTDTNNSPAITAANKRNSENIEKLTKKEKRKSTNSCQLS